MYRLLALALCLLLAGCAAPSRQIAMSCAPVPSPCPALGIDDSDRLTNPQARRTTAKAGPQPFLSYERWGAVKPPTDEARHLLVMPDGRTLLVR